MTIELPDWAVPNGASPALIDFGHINRPATGAEVGRVDRKGNRYRATVTLPPMTPQESRVVISRLIGAKSEGLRIDFPLLEKQGSPGAPVVDGAGQAGATLALRGLTRGYTFREGYWLSIVDENGRHYLHNCRTTLRVGDDGLAVITLGEHLRWPFLDGAAVQLAVPQMEGIVDGSEWGWQIPVNRLVAIEFPIEEAA